MLEVHMPELLNFLSIFLLYYYFANLVIREAHYSEHYPGCIHYFYYVLIDEETKFFQTEP